jgi:hypothetical protein
MDKDKLIQKFKNMKQYQNLSDIELEQLVQKKIDEEGLLMAFIGLSDEEKKKAIKLYDQYISEHSFESLAEKSTLINLVYLEILNDRVKLFIEQEGNEKQGAIPIKMTEQLVANTNQVMELKEKLGMLKNKEDESALDLINELRTKALAYYSEHAGCTVIKCPHCQQLFNLLMDITNLTPEKCSFFRGTMLYNLPLLNLYHLKKITKVEVSEVLGVHQNYVDFIYNNLYLKELENNGKN